MNEQLKKKALSIKKIIAPSFDVVVRYVCVQQHEMVLIFISSLSDSQLITSLVEGLTVSATSEIQLIFYPGAVTPVKNEHEAITNILSGQCVVLLDTSKDYFCIETRRYPSRNTAEPMVERSIRGAHDGFVENIILNVGLIRRRVRDPQLHIVLNKEGIKTRTDIAYAYIEHLVNQDILDDFVKRLQSIDETEIVSERILVEKLYGKTMNPYPHVRYTERPDICAIHLLQGYIIVIVDNCPTAIILPTTFFEQIKQIEEYTQTTIIALFTRIIRIIGIIFSLYLLPLWIALLVDQNPTMLNLPMKEIHLYTFGFQVIFADIVVEWIRQSLIHTPMILSSIMSFVAVFLLGDMAIELGAYTKEILIMIALSNIGNLLTPSYELSLANKMFRILIGMLALFFGQVGFCIGVFIHIIVLLSTQTIKFPYLYPIIPFSYRECYRMLIGKPITLKKDK